MGRYKLFLIPIHFNFETVVTYKSRIFKRFTQHSDPTRNHFANKIFNETNTTPCIFILPDFLIDVTDIGIYCRSGKLGKVLLLDRKNKYAFTVECFSKYFLMFMIKLLSDIWSEWYKQFYCRKINTGNIFFYLRLRFIIKLSCNLSKLKDTHIYWDIRKWIYWEIISKHKHETFTLAECISSSFYILCNNYFDVFSISLNNFVFHYYWFQHINLFK